MLLYDGWELRQKDGGQVRLRLTIGFRLRLRSGGQVGGQVNCGDLPDYVVFQA